MSLTVNIERIGKKNLKAKIGNSLVESRYEYTYNEKQLLLLLISSLDYVKFEDGNYALPYIELKLHEVLRVLNKHPNNTKEIKNTIELLMSRNIKIYDGSDGSFSIYSWFTEAGINYNSKKIKFQFHHKLLEHLINLRKNFTVVPIEYALKMNSKYSIRLYELLRRFIDVGIRTEKFSDLVDKLSVSHRKVGDIIRLIKQSCAEITEKTDISVSVDFEIVCKKISMVSFKISKKSTISLMDDYIMQLWDYVSRQFSYMQFYLFKKVFSDEKLKFILSNCSPLYISKFTDVKLFVSFLFSRVNQYYSNAVDAFIKICLDCEVSLQKDSPFREYLCLYEILMINTLSGNKFEPISCSIEGEISLEMIDEIVKYANSLGITIYPHDYVEEYRKFLHENDLNDNILPLLNKKVKNIIEIVAQNIKSF